MGNKQKVFRAGMIPYVIKDRQIHMLFMKPSDPAYGGSDYQIIKGKVEEGEHPLQAAIREAKEEAGLFPPNIANDPHHLGRFLGRTDIYVCKIKNVDLFGDPTTPEEVESTAWLTPEEFQKIGRDLHKPVVKAAVRWIEKTEGIK